MITETELPEWLFRILKGLKAAYNPKQDMARSNLYANKEEVREYLGTYLPRSYCEVFCIMDNLFQNPGYRELLTNNELRKEEINILDIGCGTGGDIVGLLNSLNKYMPWVNINVWAFDGNDTSLEYMNDVVNAFNANCWPFNAVVNPNCHTVESESDLSDIANNVSSWQFDYILCCKVCNELLFHHNVAEPYLSVARNFSGMLKQNGIMLILDPTDRFSEDASYLPTLMNRELNSFFSYSNGSDKTFGDEFVTLMPKPCGELPNCNKGCYMQKEFRILFPKKPMKSFGFIDTSKVCYRIICRKKLRDELFYNRRVLDNAQVISVDIKNNIYYCCERSKGSAVDAFDINS